jgi:hypothetical protein
MARHKLQPTVIAALLSAGATEEMIRVAQQILTTCHTSTIGRPRKWKNRAERDRAYRERRKQREKTCEDILARLYDAAQCEIELAPTSRRSLPSSTRAEPRRVPFDEARARNHRAKALSFRARTFTRTQERSGRCDVGCGQGGEEGEEVTGRDTRGPARISGRPFQLYSYRASI